MFPLYDESAKSLKPPYLTILLIFINVLIFGFTFFSGNFEEIVLEYGTIPNQILKGGGLLTLLTSTFLHAGFLHLIGNMWFLWLFGDNLEHSLGKIRFIIFYLLVGIIASIINVYMAPFEHMDIPTIGASGAISGLLGGYVILFPRNKIRAFMMIYFRPILFYVPAYIYVGVWFLYQLLYAGTPTSVAYMAHIGGFIGGMILILLLRKKKIRKD
ncbi:rhomboid family intramembrane serine protease [Patescibacteria group bacterium]|nr:rhomboid family intramembrane serine protease [Patescibacteria group bacterium]